MEFELGQTYSGYKFLEAVSQSRSGLEYRVQNTLIQREELLTTLPAAARDDSEETDRFMCEMRLRAGMVHPNIPAFFNAMTLEGRLVMTSELVKGVSLAQRLKFGPLPWREAIDCARQIVAALNCVHQRQVVHRDVSPENFIICSGGVLKLTRFRLVKSIDSPHSNGSGGIVGTLQYISPEQVKGTEAVDQRSDLYSIGAVLYEMLAGRVPFHSNSQFELMLAHVNQQPEPPSKLVASVPPELDAVVLKALAKSPDDRFQNAGEFDEALAECVSGPVSSDAVVETHVAETTQAETTQAETTEAEMLAASLVESPPALVESAPALEPEPVAVAETAVAELAVADTAVAEAAQPEAAVTGPPAVEAEPAAALAVDQALSVVAEAVPVVIEPAPVVAEAAAEPVLSSTEPPTVVEPGSIAEVASAERAESESAVADSVVAEAAFEPAAAVAELSPVSECELEPVAACVLAEAPVSESLEPSAALVATELAAEPAAEAATPAVAMPQDKPEPSVAAAVLAESASAGELTTVSVATELAAEPAAEAATPAVAMPKEELEPSVAAAVVAASAPAAEPAVVSAATEVQSNTQTAPQVAAAPSPLPETVAPAVAIPQEEPEPIVAAAALAASAPAAELALVSASAGVQSRALTVPQTAAAPALLPETAVYATPLAAAEIVCRAAAAGASQATGRAPIFVEPRHVPAQSTISAAAPSGGQRWEASAPAWAPISQPMPATQVPSSSPSEIHVPPTSVNSRLESIQWAVLGGTAGFLGVVLVTIWLVAGK